MDVKGKRPCPCCCKQYSFQDIREYRKRGSYNCPNCRTLLAIRTNDDDTDWQWVGLKTPSKLMIGARRNLYAKLPKK